MRSACRSILVLGLGLAALSLALPAVAQTASPVFPYKAYISANGVYVRSGPGRNYYPTEKMKEGQEIEVYRHDPGGWYAIKPPEGSFTWVAARYLKPESENLASVIGDRVAARVGSRFSNIRDVIQLRLDREETVELLGAEPQGVGAQAEIWCRISPPAGEFRWVHGKYVDANFPHSGIRKTGPRHTPAGTSDHEGQAVAHSEPPTDRSSITPAAVVRAFEEDAPADQTRQPSPQPVSRAESRWNDDLQEEIEDIDLELSVMLAEEASVWEFSELAARARTVIDRAETALQRGRARVLINKIARSDDIRRRYQQVHAMREVVEQRNGQLSQIAETRKATTPHLPPPPSFDAQGQLKAFASEQAGAPPYALVDEVGRVQAYVSPAPGVNLRPYVGRRIGVTGVSGYLPDRDAQHVAVKHISALDTRRR